MNQNKYEKLITRLLIHCQPRPKLQFPNEPKWSRDTLQAAIALRECLAEIKRLNIECSRLAYALSIQEKNQ